MKRIIIENGYETVINNTVKVRVYNTVGENTTVEFLEKTGENSWYITSSKNMEQKERFKKLMNQYKEYVMNPRGITPIE